MTTQPLQTSLQEHTITFPDPFPLECGAVLPGITVRYHSSYGTHTGRNVIWICHALTANSNPADWWPTLVGTDKFFDPTQDYLICANVLGSCYGSTQPDGPDYPVISIRDMVQAHEKLRQHLGIDNIHLLIGGSSGGFQSVEWAVNHPHVCNNLCLIACSAQISPWATALNESQRMALHAGPPSTTATEHLRPSKLLQPPAGPGFNLSPGNEAGNNYYARLQRAGRGASIALLSYRSYEGYCNTSRNRKRRPYSYPCRFLPTIPGTKTGRAVLCLQLLYPYAQSGFTQRRTPPRRCTDGLVTHYGPYPLPGH